MTALAETWEDAEVLLNAACPEGTYADMLAVRNPLMAKSGKDVYGAWCREE